MAEMTAAVMTVKRRCGSWRDSLVVVGWASTAIIAGETSRRDEERVLKFPGRLPWSNRETDASLIQQLEASGSVERQPSPLNARILNAQLTQMGEKKWRSINDDVMELEQRLLLGLSRAEVRALNRSLETIIRNMTPTS